MIEICVLLLCFLLTFGVYGLEAFISDFIDSFKKKNWKFPVAMSVFMVVSFFVWYGVLKCLNLLV